MRAIVISNSLLQETHLATPIYLPPVYMHTCSNATEWSHCSYIAIVQLLLLLHISVLGLLHIFCMPV